MAGRPVAVSGGIVTKQRRRQQEDRALVPTRAIQIALGCLWLADGLLQLQPYMFSPHFLQDTIASNAQGQPWVIHDSIVALVQVALPYRVLLNACFALLQLGIGFGLIASPSTVKPALLLSFGWSLVVWWVGEGLGMLAMGTASPMTGAPGPVLLYALIGLMVWPTARDGASGCGVLLGDLGGRILWASLWLLFAGLMLLPFNRAPNAAEYTFAAAATFIGHGPLASLDTMLASVSHGHGLLAAMSSAVLMALVGLLVLLNWRRNLILALGAVIGAIFFGTSEFWVGSPPGRVRTQTADR